MKRFFLLIIFFSLISQSSSSQVTMEWYTTYHGPGGGSDRANAMVLDNDGNVYVTGYSLDSPSGSNASFLTIKYNSNGEEQWARLYKIPGSTWNEALGIGIDNMNNIYVTGYAHINSTVQCLTLKYNSQGSLNWFRTYGSGINNYSHSIAVDGEGNVVITGYTLRNNTGRDYLTIKYNTNGVQQWVALYVGPGSFPNDRDEAYKVCLDDIGNVYVTGWSTADNSYRDFATVKYNSQGVQQWVRRYNGPASARDEAFCLYVDESYNVYVSGYSEGTNSDLDYATVKYNSTGAQQWVARYNGPNNLQDIPVSIVVDQGNNGGVYVTGYSLVGGQNYDFATVKYNHNGIEQWNRRYSGSGVSDDKARAMTKDNLGNIYVTGINYVSTSNIMNDIITLKYNSDGEQIWEHRFIRPQNLDEQSKDILVRDNGDLYITGYAYSFGQSYNALTFKLSQSVGVNVISNVIPDEYSLHQNFPNPFNPSTTISFDIPQSALVKLTVYDALGREVAMLVNENLTAGSYNYQFSTDNFQLGSGVYLYRLQAGSFVETKRLVLLK